MIMKIGLCLILVFVGLTVAVLFSSCCLFTVNKYDVVFRNIGTHNLFVTSGIIGNYVPPVGVLNPNLYKGSIAHSGIPETVKIKWRKEDGVVVEKEVGVKENMPKGFCNGDTIIFNINDNDEIILSFEVKGFKYEIDSKGNRIDFKEPSTVQEEKRCQAVEVNE